MEEDDAVPRLLGRGHSSIAHHHEEEEGEMRTPESFWTEGNDGSEMVFILQKQKLN